MRRWCGRPRTSRRSAGARRKEIFDVGLSFLVTPDRRVLITELAPGGPAAKLGFIAVGDTIAAVDDEPARPRAPAPRPPRAPGSAHARAAGQVPSEPGADVQAFIPPPPSRTDWTRLVPPPVLTGHASARTCRRSSARGVCGAKGSPVVLTLLKGAGPSGGFATRHHVQLRRTPPPPPSLLLPLPVSLLYTHSLPLEQVQLRRTHLFGATAMRPRLAAPDSALGAPGNRPPPAPPPRRRHSRLSRLSVARKLAGDATQPASLRVRMRA